MKIEKPNFTQVPNLLLDNMCKFTHTEFKLLMFVSRMTFGFHQDKHRMSFSYLEDKTGMARDTISNAIHTLLAKGVLVRVQHGETFKYSLDIDMVGESNQSEIPTKAVGESNQQLVGESDSYKETISKETNKETSAVAVNELKAEKTPVKKFTELWCLEFPKHHQGCKYLYGGAKDTEAAKKMLGVFPPEELIALAIKAWKNKADFNCKQAVTIAGMGCRFNEIQQFVISPPPRDPFMPTRPAVRPEQKKPFTGF